MAKKILIVEDEPALLQALMDRLQRLGYETITAVDGVDAIKKIKSSMPDLVLLDIIMPKKSGFEVIEEIRYRMKSTVPIIVLSNLEQKQDIETAKNLGVTNYYLKSNISLRNLAIEIDKILTGQK